ncbi:MAG: aminopeptidase [Gemmatimonadetes bacterium]|nr:aminopeptidase [Gemmatimonadota bacterium]
MTTLLLLVGLAAGCSPVYVLKAGYHEARILAARRPIRAVIADPRTDVDTRGKLEVALAARAFARDSLVLDVNGSYSTFVQLDRDTLTLILSGAHQDRLEPVTWWFPIVGRVPYRGYFGLEEALSAEERLKQQGFDTYVRPAAAFSTLGWFADPLLSTLLRYDAVGLVETIIHELTHNTIYLAGYTDFNESLASFVGARGAIAFFCGPTAFQDAGRCELAQDRWSDELIFSGFMDTLITELETLYGRSDLTREVKIERREEVFAEARRHFVENVQPAFRASRFPWVLDEPLNNATLLARLHYYRRLGDFDATLGGQEDLQTTIRRIAQKARDLVRSGGDPFEALVPASAAQPDR